MNRCFDVASRWISRRRRITHPGTRGRPDCLHSTPYSVQQPSISFSSDLSFSDLPFFSCLFSSISSSCLSPFKNLPIFPRTLSVKDLYSFANAPSVCALQSLPLYIQSHSVAADKREFIKISQAVGMGFLIMVRLYLFNSVELKLISSIRAPLDISLS